MVADAENDADKQTPIVQQLEANSTGGDPNDPDDKEQAQNDTIDKILQDAEKLPQTKGKTTHYAKDGGFTRANREFDSLNLKNVKDIQVGRDGVGRTGRLENGTNVTVRSRSIDGRPTLEIQKSPKKIEIRYNITD
jgi:hypothetical protein